jgi:tight adherence protein B
VSRLLRLAVLPAVLAAALTAVPFAVGAESQVSLAEAAGAQFPDRAYVLTLPFDRPLSASQLVVRENGDGVKGLTVVPATAAGSNQFGVVLVLDASNSMKGKPIAGALSAAQLFVAHRSRSQQVAVVTFNKDPQVALPFTTNSTEILDSLAHRPELVYGTHIYDSVLESISLLREARITAGSVVLLSDGSDTGSVASHSDVVAAAKQAHVRVFAVGLRSKDFDPTTLRKLASETSGTFSEATSVADLSSIYDRLGTQLSREYLLRYQSYQSLGEPVRVSVQVKGLGNAAQSGYATPGLAPPPIDTYHRGFGNGFWLSPFTMIVFSTFAIGFLAFCIFTLLQPRRRSVQKRLAEFVSLAQPADGKSVGKALPERFVDSTEKSLDRSPWWSRFLVELEIAEIEVNPLHIVVWTLLGTIAFMWLIAVLFTFAAVVLGIFVPFAVWSFIKRKAERRRAQFAEQLPDNLAVLASAIRAGHSFVGALSVVVNDAPEPARSEFQRVVADEQLGRPLDEALEVVVERMRNQDLAQVALVAALQRETGGSTAEVLERVVETVRDRQELRRLVRTLTAAGRMSRWVVSFLPLVLVVAIWILSPSYLDPLFSHTSGRILFVFATVLVITGSMVIKRIVDIKV